jgi:hypothetical protein
MAALQFASFGLIGELLTRLYFKDSAQRPYIIRRDTISEPTLFRPAPDVEAAPVGAVRKIVGVE